MEASCLCPSEGHGYGKLKLTKTCNLVLLQKAYSRIQRSHKHLPEYLFSFKDCSDSKISADKSLFLTCETAFSAASLISCHAKLRKFNIALLQDEKPHKTEKLSKHWSSAVPITS